jgi:hypothetical protein
MQYKILNSYSSYRLEEEVQKHLNTGFSLKGKLRMDKQLSTTLFIQVVVKHETT